MFSTKATRSAAGQVSAWKPHSLASAAHSLLDWPMTSDSESKLLPEVTLVLWLVCLAVGIAGWCLPYLRSRPPSKQAEPVQAELVDIKIAREPSRASPPQSVSP